MTVEWRFYNGYEAQSGEIEEVSAPEGDERRASAETTLEDQAEAMKHWHRCRRWLKLGLKTCPMARFEDHEEEGGGAPEDPGAPPPATASSCAGASVPAAQEGSSAREEGAS